ncbi:transporter [Parafrankia colletiae]|uniref:Transporter n=1 Tax=Parafrankia colletiae TaxID=573497 RepID=A0A1S1QKJ3_9ACTN|nr:transporter [Parafrankia colletiae]MCK9900045.1 transporter [Frankia sp. Cpl3]OHV33795.1 transporter [Parafrankia colletiae]
MDEQTAAAAGARPTSRLVVDVVRALRGWVVAAAGGVLLLGCYLGVSKETEVAYQLPYVVSGGFGGLALVLVGSALLVADRVDATQATQSRLASQMDDLHTLIIAAAASGAADADRAGAPNPQAVPGHGGPGHGVQGHSVTGQANAAAVSGQRF